VRVLKTKIKPILWVARKDVYHWMEHDIKLSYITHNIVIGFELRTRKTRLICENAEGAIESRYNILMLLWSWIGGKKQLGNSVWYKKVAKNANSDACYQWLLPPLVPLQQEYCGFCVVHDCPHVESWPAILTFNNKHNIPLISTHTLGFGCCIPPWLFFKLANHIYVLFWFYKYYYL